MSESGGVKEGLTPKEFFESEWYKDGCRQLCADGWPTFIVPVNIQIKKLQSENQGLRAVLNSALIYLHWRGDDLCGDDLKGDGKLTKRYKKQIEEIEKALQSGDKN